MQPECQLLFECDSCVTSLLLATAKETENPVRESTPKPKESAAKGRSKDPKKYAIQFT